MVIHPKRVPVVGTNGGIWRKRGGRRWRIQVAVKIILVLLTRQHSLCNTTGFTSLFGEHLLVV